MKYLQSLFVCLLCVSILNAQKLMGFSEANATKEVDWEKQFDAQLSGKDQDEWMKFLSSHPHHVGSPQDKANAEYMANLFRQWGYDVEIATYYPLFPTPKSRSLELLGAKPYKAKLDEGLLKEDRTSGQK